MWMGAKAAQKWTDAHEYGDEGNDGYSVEMDFSNNTFGRNMALSIPTRGAAAEMRLSAYLQVAVANGYLVREEPVKDGTVEEKKLVPTNGDGRWLPF